VIIGGLLFSLGLTLYVIPALYTYLSTEKKSALVPVAEPVETESV
jgi:multidrug efflux pump